MSCANLLLVSVKEASAIGLANYAVPKAEVAAKARELALEIASAAPIAVRWSKMSLVEHAPFKPHAAAMLEAHMQSRSFETEDSSEGVRALLEKSPARFAGR